MENKADKYNLEKRTQKFGIEIIKFSKKIPKNVINLPLINQLVKSGTSIGANYCEADDAESPMDFRHKIGICKKEARETMHWMIMINESVPELKSECKAIWQEAKELNLIFNSISQKIKKKGF